MALRAIGIMTPAYGGGEPGASRRRTPAIGNALLTMEAALKRMLAIHQWL
jgi:hypothetical protein